MKDIGIEQKIKPSYIKAKKNKKTSNMYILIASIPTIVVDNNLLKKFLDEVFIAEVNLKNKIPRPDP